MIRTTTDANGNVLRVDELRLSYIGAGQEDPGGDGPIATLNGVEVPIVVVDQVVPDPVDGSVAIQMGDGRDETDAANSVAAHFATAGFTNSDSYDPGGGDNGGGDGGDGGPGEGT